MANLDNRPTGYGATIDRSSVGVLDEGLRAFMLRVYNYMAIGLVITGLAAYGVFSLATTTDPSQAVGQLGQGLMLTSFGATLYGSPLMWLVILAPLALVFVLSFGISRMSVGAAQATFWVYAA